MPTLEFAHKHIVERHHEKVPFRLLKKHPRKGRKPPAGCEGNMIIHGDNLEALQALMPYYYGRVKLVFIDPPYNTGNEGWTYSDRVNSPAMRRWLKEAVGRDDGNRHDKWLCMMWPRLTLLRKLLAKDGSLWMTLDDNEMPYARAMLDEVFGRENFVAQVVWQKVYSPKNTAKHLSEDHDYILIYAKNGESWRPNLIPRSEEADKRYKNPDNDPRGPWKTGDLSARNYYSEGTYEITGPSGRVIAGPPTGMYWRVSKQNFRKMDSDNRIWWGRTGNSIPQIKRFLSEVKQGIVPQTLWFYQDVGHTQEAKKELVGMMDFADSGEVFITPKPTRLIQRILQIATDKDSIVLDSFAGSGTTGHAVLKQNTADGGRRRFVMVEMEDYADKLTAERIRRAIKGYGANGKKTTGLPGGFDYFSLDKPLFSPIGEAIESSVSFSELGGFVYFLETGQPGFDCPARGPLIGDFGDMRYFMLYVAKGKPTVLDEAAMSRLTKKADGKQPVIYADRLSVDDKKLTKANALFRKIPRDIQDRVIRFREEK